MQPFDDSKAPIVNDIVHYSTSSCGDWLGYSDHSKVREYEDKNFKLEQENERKDKEIDLLRKMLFERLE